MTARIATSAFVAGILAVLCMQAARAEDPAFRFDKEDYYLRSTEGGIYEYLPAGETFKKWNTLMAVRGFEGTDDAHAYAAKILDNVKSSDPEAKGLLLQSGDSYYVDFLMFSEEGTKPSFAEWNVWRIRKKGGGIQAVQYARRFYKFDESAGREISAAREKILGELADLQSPR